MLQGAGVLKHAGARGAEGCSAITKLSRRHGSRLCALVAKIPDLGVGLVGTDVAQRGK